MIMAYPKKSLLGQNLLSIKGEKTSKLDYIKVIIILFSLFPQIQSLYP